MANQNFYSFAELTNDVFGLSTSDSEAIDFTTAKSSDGKEFPIIGFKDGGVYTDTNGKERESYTFFALSRKTSAEVSSKEDLEDWLVANLQKARFVLPEDMTKEDGSHPKFGSIFLSVSRRKSLDDLLAKAIAYE